MIYNENSRAFASFSGSCPYNCLHCYTFSEEFINRGKNNVQRIIDDLKQKEFNIVYISGYKENFANPSEGITLLEEIYNVFCCDILVTTRNVFDDNQIERLVRLSKRMLSTGNQLFFCVSIPAYDSYKLLEPNPIIPSPSQRLDFIKKLYALGISTIMTIRPLCPNTFVPISESLKLINEIKGYCSAIISSGIVVDDFILKRIATFPEEFDYEERNIMNCLENNISVKYVNVDEELKQIKESCAEFDIPFFTNSLPAINFISSNKNIK